MRPPNTDTCPRCGVIFAKVRQRSDQAPAQSEEAVYAPAAVAGGPAASGVVAARCAFLALLAFYSLRILSHSIASNYVGETFLHLVNLPFHEAGHVLFSPLGRFLQVAGGTIMQLLVPVVVAISFYMRRDFYAAAVGIWWLGESMADVAPYADDARAGQLPLLGGVTGSEVEDYHDWEVMLGKLGLLTWDHGIGTFFFAAGGVVMAAAIIWGTMVSLRQHSAERG
ncbi:hypothetical protein GMPD_12420 [Geomonas paludis]|uniref:Zinc ribbon domain-containing protein n=2 Tax=Geomonas paludis TaxID=2740185 RepID=A0A6V8MUT4_9BACT|nr:hypothetical protein GMPD_12420 [Geomonas paludis]